MIIKVFLAWKQKRTAIFSFFLNQKSESFYLVMVYLERIAVRMKTVPEDKVMALYPLNTWMTTAASFPATSSVFDSVRLQFNPYLKTDRKPTKELPYIGFNIIEISVVLKSWQQIFRLNYSFSQNISVFSQS
jgi:hypothetical protein